MSINLVVLGDLLVGKSWVGWKDHANGIGLGLRYNPGIFRPFGVDFVFVLFFLDQDQAKASQK